MKQLISFAAFAKKCGVTRQAVYKAINGPLAGAVVRSAGRSQIDLDHLEAMIYQARQQHAGKISKSDQLIGNSPQTIIDATLEDLKESAAEIDDANLPKDPSEFLNWPLARIIKTFGTAPRFKDWLDARKKISDITEKDLKNSILMGKLTSVELFKRDIYPAIDSCFIKILGDAAKTCAARAETIFKSGESVNDVEKLIHDTVSTHIQVAQTRIKRTLDSIKEKAAKDQDHDFKT